MMSSEIVAPERVKIAADDDNIDHFLTVEDPDEDSDKYKKAQKAFQEAQKALQAARDALEAEQTGSAK